MNLPGIMALRERKLLWRISVIAVIVATVVGVLVGIHLASSSLDDVKDRAIGANVTVSGKIPSNMKAATVPAQPKFVAGFTPLGSTINITPSGGLSAPVILRFRLNAPLSGKATVFIGTSESINGPWILMKPTISQDGQYATVQASHLSFFHFVQLDPSGIIDFLKESIGGLTSDLFTAASPPHCNSDWYKESQTQRDNYTIGSGSKSGKSALYWCFGMEGFQRILKIVNRMRYPLDISHPGFNLIRTSGPQLQLDAERLAHLGVGDDLILFPFEEADFSVNLPPGVDTALTSESSPLTEGLGFFEAALTVVLAIVEAVEKVVVEVSETAVTIFEDGKRTTVVISSSKMTLELVDALAYTMNKFLEFKDCFNTFVALKSTHNFGAFVGAFLSSCIKNHIEDGVKALVQGLGVVIAFAITAAISLILNFGAIISYAIGFGNDWNDSHQDAGNYHITVSRTRTSSSGNTGGSGDGSGDGNGGGAPPANASIQIGWSSAHPTYIWMMLKGFALGSYQYTCNFSTGGNGTFTINVTSNPQTFDNGHTCFDTESGDNVWVTIGSVKSNEISVAAPPPPPSASIQIGWSASHPTWIWMTLKGFAPGSYRYTCSFNTGGDGTFTINVTSNPQTFDNGHTCYDTVSGDKVWVVIGSVKSNIISVAAPPPPSTHAETAGPPSGSGTFTNYTNAGGTLGTRVAPYQTIQVSCKLTGWTAPDGDNWWYRIASSPWNNVYYAPADNFYNNGQTSGSLSGTPFVDPNVPNC